MLRRAAPALAVCLLVAGDAGAYCRSSVCDVEGERVQGKVCTPAEDDDCGLVLSWPQPCIGFTVFEAASRQIDRVTAAQVMAAAFIPWTQAGCGAGTPSIQVDDLGVVACGKIEYNQHGGNANVLIFHDDAWPHKNESVDGTTDTIALTTVTYDVDKGEIFDADIEVNAAQNTFTTTDDLANVQVDLLSVLTHEAGHFLGLAHSGAPESTMTPIYPGGIDLRTIGDDDTAGICAVYPPGRSAEGDCTGIPRHGFSPACLDDQTEGTCSAAPGRGSAGDPAPLACAAILALAASLRRLTNRSAARAR